MTAHELVIRFGRPLDIQADRGGPFRADVREVTIPFADRESAEAAQRELIVHVRQVRDAGGEDYRPVVVGEVVRDAPMIDGNVRTSSNLNGFTEVETRIIPEGVLQVTSRYAAIKVDDPLPKVIGWRCTMREATLNGELVPDPQRAQALADKAGIITAEPVRWEGNSGGGG